MIYIFLSPLLLQKCLDHPSKTWLKTGFNRISVAGFNYMNDQQYEAPFQSIWLDLFHIWFK